MDVVKLTAMRLSATGSDSHGENTLYVSLKLVPTLRPLRSRTCCSQMYRPMQARGLSNMALSPRPSCLCRFFCYRGEGDSIYHNLQHLTDAE